jgi:membrane-bound metal-dependent hydrolase YbcI (DUF457 family)
MALLPMEPLAHTLAGACLAESGLKRLSPLAASTLIIAANIPDLDGACYLHSADLAFAFRRGVTHGVLAMAVLPLALTAAMLAYDRLVTRRRTPGAPRPAPRVLLALSAVGVLSHPFLDWLNNYGVRLLAPFSDRWFYGDTLFIADPWLWLILGGAVMLSWTAHTRGLVTAAVLALGTTALMLLTPIVPGWARAAWMAGLAVWAVARVRVGAARRPAIAAAALAAALLYIGVMFAGSRLAERQVRDLARGARVGRRTGGRDAGPGGAAPAIGHRRVARPVPDRARELGRRPGARRRAGRGRAGREGRRRRGRPLRALRARRARLAALSELRGAPDGRRRPARDHQGRPVRDRQSAGIRRDRHRRSRQAPHAPPGAVAHGLIPARATSSPP